MASPNDNCALVGTELESSKTAEGGRTTSRHGSRDYSCCAGYLIYKVYLYVVLGHFEESFVAQISPVTEAMSVCDGRTTEQMKPEGLVVQPLICLLSLPMVQNLEVTGLSLAGEKDGRPVGYELWCGRLSR